MIGAVINNLWRLALALPLLVGFFDDATAIPHKALESRDVIDRMIFAHFMVSYIGRPFLSNKLKLTAKGWHS